MGFHSGLGAREGRVPGQEGGGARPGRTGQGTRGLSADAVLSDSRWGTLRAKRAGGGQSQPPGAPSSRLGGQEGRKSQVAAQLGASGRRGWTNYTASPHSGPMAGSSATRAAHLANSYSASQDNADPGPRAAALGKENSLNKSFWCLIN